MQLRRARSTAQHKIINLNIMRFFVIACCNVFHVWPKTTLQLIFFFCGPEIPKVSTPLLGFKALALKGCDRESPKWTRVRLARTVSRKPSNLGNGTEGN